MCKVLSENDQMCFAFIILKELQSLSQRNWTEVHRRKILSCEIKHYSWKLVSRSYKENQKYLCMLPSLQGCSIFSKNP